MYHIALLLITCPWVVCDIRSPSIERCKESSMSILDFGTIKRREEQRQGEARLFGFRLGVLISVVGLFESRLLISIEALKLVSQSDLNIWSHLWGSMR